jgi:polyferredoxin
MCSIFWIHRFQLILLFLLFAPSMARTEERFMPPEFTSGYQLPPTKVPAAPVNAFGYFDVAMLAAAMVLATWMTIRRRPRWEFYGLMVFSLLYFGFYRRGCVCPIGAIQNVALAAGDSTYALPWTVGLFFVLPLIFALFVGRVFCGAVCPLGAAQDIVLLRPLRTPIWLEHALSLIPFVYLGLAVLFAATGSWFVICEYDPFVLFFRRSGPTEMAGAGLAVLLIAVLVGRPYCRFACPYGALLRLLAPLAHWRIRIGPSECVRCRLCHEDCPFGAIHHPSEGHPVGARKSLTAWWVALPVALALFGWLGHAAGGTFARLNPTVRLAEQVWLEGRGETTETTKESEAFQKLGIAQHELLDQAAAIRVRFETGSLLLGLWIGLVVGLKLGTLAMPRPARSVYEIDMAQCVACGRCMETCRVRRSRPEGAL